MKNLWSPWRSKYIESFKEEQSGGKCIFCQAVDKEISDMSNLVVHKSKNTIVMLNLYPYNNGHLLIIPKKHVDSIQDINKEVANELIEQIIFSEKVLTEVYKPQGFNIGANLGRAGGAGIKDHIHFHIVPRWNGDTNFMPVIGEVKVISQDLAVSKKNIIEAYQKFLK